MEKLFYPIFKLPDTFIDDTNLQKIPLWIKYYLYHRSYRKLSEVLFGSNFVLENTVKRKFKKFEITGDTGQAQYTGKNKFNINGEFSWIGANTSYSVNGNTLNVSGYWYVGMLVTVKANTDYYLNTVRNIITSASGIGKIVIYQSNKSTQIGRQLTDAHGTFNSGDNTQIYVVFYAGSGSGDGEVEFSNIQLEEGTTATPFEQFVRRNTKSKSRV